MWRERDCTRKISGINLSVYELDYMTSKKEGPSGTPAFTKKGDDTMQLVRTRPLRSPHDLEALLEVLPDPFAPRFGIARGHRAARRSWVPRVDVHETQDALTVRYELAGFRLEDLEVTLDDNLLTVKGTRSSEAPEGAVYRIRELAHGAFSRSIRVSDDFDPEKVGARFSDGLLEIVIRKRPEVQPRTIQIESASN